jgi:hypothetical protein
MRGRLDPGVKFLYLITVKRLYTSPRSVAMTREASIVRFPGDPQQLMPRYAEGLRRFGAAHPHTRPEVIFVGRSDQTPNALVAILLWPEGVSHGLIGEFLLPLLKELGLERPTVDHLSVGPVGFDAVAAVRAP